MSREISKIRIVRRLASPIPKRRVASTKVLTSLVPIIL